MGYSRMVRCLMTWFQPRHQRRCHGAAPVSPSEFLSRILKASMSSAQKSRSWGERQHRGTNWSLWLSLLERTSGKTENWYDLIKHPLPWTVRGHQLQLLTLQLRRRMLSSPSLGVLRTIFKNSSLLSIPSPSSAPSWLMPLVGFTSMGWLTWLDW